MSFGLSVPECPRSTSTSSSVAPSSHSASPTSRSTTSASQTKQRSDPEWHPPADQTNAGQIISFAYRMQVGDIVVVPRLTTRHKDFLVARVVSPYQYVPDAPASGPHRRSVEWLGRFEKDALSQGAINTLGAFLTVGTGAGIGDI